MKSLFKRLGEQHPFVAWLSLVLSLLVTGWAWFITDKAVDKLVTDRFQFLAQDVASAITSRMQEYEFVLRSGQALFDASNEVTREDWAEYSATIHLQKYFPGIQALGYSLMLSPDEVEAHVSKIRQEGFPEYEIRPASPEREQYSTILYIEPFDWRNQRAFGYDMFSEPNRRAAMERARDADQPSASGRVTLMQETDEHVQYGFLMYYPIYQNQLPVETVEQRREALTSYVYAAFRMGDLMEGILGPPLAGVDFELFDTVGRDEHTLLYRSDQKQNAEQESTKRVDSLNETFNLNIAGRTWTLYIHGKPAFIAFSERYQAEFIAVVGFTLSIFLFYLITYLVRGRNLAKNFAEKAQSERELTQQRMQLAAEAAGMGLSVWSLPDNRMYWDSRMLSLYGYTEDDFTGEVTDWQRRVHPDDIDQVKKDVHHARKYSQRFELKFRIVLPGGAVRHMAASMMIERDKTGQVVRMVGFNRDVTEQREAENALNENNWRLKNVLDGTNAGTWEWNVQTGETKFNERWAEIIGYSLSALEPVSIDTWLQLTHPDDLKRSNAILQRHFAGETEFYNCEYRIRHYEGHWVWVLDRGKVFSWDRAGKPLLMFGTHQDITEQKLHELLLKEERDKAEMANCARGEFLANMSHEIRTPVNGVIGTLSLLTDTTLTASQKNLVDLSRRSADTLLGLINDILDLSKIESGKLKIIEEQVDLLAIVNEAGKALAARAEAKGIRLLCPEHFLQPYTILSDKLRLRQILTNLLSNAVKFTEQGQVTVDVDILEQTTSRLHVRFNVKDTGPGISKQNQQALFQRFQQLDNSLTRKAGGTGLGLAICKQLTEMMGGTIGVDSEEGRGARFWFEMSFVRQDADKPGNDHPFHDLHVCIVGVTPLYRRFYDSLFTAWGVEHDYQPDYASAQCESDKVSARHRLIIMDADTVGEQDSGSYQGEREKRPLLLMTCPQSMLSVMPVKISDMADLIVSHPLVQSELYNAILSIVHEEQPPSRLAAAVHPELLMFNARLLVVEDNPTNIIIIRGLLEKFGVTVSIAEDGLEALSLLHEQTFDLVLMDCQMPRLDGYEATRRLRSDPAVVNNGVTVIALTAHAMREDQQKCLDAGMDDYLSKPVEPQLLNQKLARWLPPDCIR